MTLKSTFRYVGFTLLATIFFIVVWSFVTAWQWKNNITSGISKSEGLAIVDVYNRTTNTYENGFLGINFYVVHKGNSQKMFDNVLYQADYIDQVGELYSFAIKDYGTEENLFFWLNYYPESPKYFKLSNLVEVYKAWILAGIPMTFLSDEYEWFPLANYKVTRQTGIEFPQTSEDIERDLEYKDFEKFPTIGNYESFNAEAVNSWLTRISRAPALTQSSLYVNYFVIPKDDLESVYEASNSIAGAMRDDKGLLLKYSYRPHGDYYSFMWVSVLPQSYKNSDEGIMEDYRHILEHSVLFERVIVAEGVKAWPASYDTMDRFQ